MKARYRLGIDIGGTFTDATLLDTETGWVTIDKVSTTPADPSEGFLSSALGILGKAGISPDEVEFVVHATAVATNAIIEGKTARTGFVTTAGFRDLLELARQMRPSLYDLRFEKPPPLVPRYLCFDVPERLDARGGVLVPFDEAAMRRVADALRDEGVEAVAVCFLHSYVNTDHEMLAGRILEEALPATVVSLSGRHARVPRVLPCDHDCHQRRDRPGRLAIPGEHRTQARCGRGHPGASDHAVERRRVHVHRGARQPRLHGQVGSCRRCDRSCSSRQCARLPEHPVFDMGGTTAKTSLVQNGTPKITKDYEVGAKAAPGTGGGRGSGYPVRTPVIELVEIGAEGGSIAWVDSGGILRVGPQSAGADPGPRVTAAAEPNRR